MAIVVVDYSKGNLSSVVRGLARVGGDAVASADPEAIAGADGLVLPGVGAFLDAMEAMAESGQVAAIRDALDRGVAFLGICLGLQLLFDEGSEGVPDGGRCPGLGVLPGASARLESRRLKVPHVGWDSIEPTERAAECPLLSGVAFGSHLYFTHSYALTADTDSGLVAATTSYGWTFPSVVWRGNVFGTQFHPEKSSQVGERILANFLEVVRTS